MTFDPPRRRWQNLRHRSKSKSSPSTGRWLFIYPQEGIASLNRLVVPAGVPLRFRLTSTTVMNSFFVPQLGSQIYTMPNMVTRLNLEADQPGTYEGLSAQFSGDGFSDMRFDLVSTEAEAFKDWFNTTKTQGGVLDARTFEELTRPAKADGAQTYARVSDGLFDRISSGHMAGRLAATRAIMFGRLTWAAIPFDQPVVMIASGTVGFLLFLRIGAGDGQRLVALLVARMDHQRRPQAHRCDVHSLGAPDAGARFLGRHVDAQPTSPCRRSRTGVFCRPNITIRSSRAHGTIMIFFVAMPFVIGLMNFVLPLQLVCAMSPFLCLTPSASGCPRRECFWSTCRWWSASSPVPAGLPIRR